MTDEELKGKTVANAKTFGNRLILLFTDGVTASLMAHSHSSEGDDDIQFRWHDRLSDWELQFIGAITEDEYGRRLAIQREKDAAVTARRERAEYERLRAKFEGKT